jgi:hypothetical protein
VTRKEAYADCFLLLCGRLPADDLIPEVSFSALDDESSTRLQDFAAQYIRLPWGTGIGTLEAIDHMVEEAESNANLKDGLRYDPDRELKHMKQVMKKLGRNQERVLATLKRHKKWSPGEADWFLGSESQTLKVMDSLVALNLVECKQVKRSDGDRAVYTPKDPS